jgi:hypothetical protein
MVADFKDPLRNHLINKLTFVSTRIFQVNSFRIRPPSNLYFLPFWSMYSLWLLVITLGLLVS